MRFSIVIPAFNRSAFLPGAIQSVLDQNCQDFELLIIDDGSTDNTRQVVEQYQASHPDKIRYIFQTNQERGAARNNGIRSSKGTFVVLLDSDDQFQNNHLQVLSESIVRYPEINFFSTNYTVQTPDHRQGWNTSKLQEGMYSYTLFLAGNPLACNVCIRRDNPKLIGFFEDRGYSAMEDWIFFMDNLVLEKIFISSCATLNLTDHPLRSMHQNKLIITRRELATRYLENRIPLTDDEKSILRGNTGYICAIHSYLENDYKTSWHYILKARSFLGLQRKILLHMLKLLAGKTITSRLSSLLK